MGGSHAGGDAGTAGLARATGGAGGGAAGSAALGGAAGRGGSDAVAPGTGGAAGRGSALGGSGGGVAGGGAPGSGGGPPPPSSGGAGGGGAGAGGDPGQALLLPSNCEARGRAATADTCMLSAICDSLAYVTNCRRLDSGRWRCTSDPRHTDRVFEIEGASGLQACAVATGLSARDQLTLGQDSCEPLKDAVGADYCTTSLVCGPPVEIDFAPNVRARLARYGSVACAPIAFPNAISCGLGVDETSTSDDLGVFSDSYDCRSMLEFCMKTTAPGFDGPRSCIVTQATSTPAGCQRSDLCSLTTAPPPPPVPPPRNPAFSKVEARYASCEPDGNGGSSCYCSGPDHMFQFRIASAPDDATCTGALANCDSTAVIEVMGAPTCTPTSQTTSSNGCDADLSCLQAATVDGRAIVAEGRLLVRCARAGQGRPWSCSCASDQLTATFALGGTAGVTPAQACTQAPATCLEHIPVHVGPAGDGAPLPDPPPL